MKPGKTGLMRLWFATRYSLAGLRFAWRNEAAFRQEVILLSILLPLAFWLGDTAVQRVLLLLSSVLILIVELLNSSIEAVVDRVGTEFHPLAGSAKDLGSAAVLLSLLLCLLTWTIILFEKFAG